MFQVTLNCNKTVMSSLKLREGNKIQVFSRHTQVVIPVSSIKEVKKHNAALSMLTIQTANEKVRLHTFRTFYILFFFYWLTLMMFSDTGNPVGVSASLGTQCFCMEM